MNGRKILKRVRTGVLVECLTCGGQATNCISQIGKCRRCKLGEKRYSELSIHRRKPRKRTTEFLPGNMHGDRIIVEAPEIGDYKNIRVKCLICGTESMARTDRIHKCRKCSPTRMQMGDKGKIYALTCPFTGKIMYVGATKNSPEIRLYQHWHSKHCESRSSRPLYAWLRSLESQGAYPGMRILEEVNGSPLAEKEIDWIRKLKREGIELFNIDGGEMPWTSE